MVFLKRMNGLYYLIQANYMLGIIFVVSAPFLIFLNTSSHYNAILMGRQLFKQVSINNTLIQICTSVVIIAAVFFTSNIYWLVTAFVLSGIIFSVLGFVHTIKKYPLNDLGKKPPPPKNDEFEWIWWGEKWIRMYNDVFLPKGTNIPKMIRIPNCNYI